MSVTPWSAWPALPLLGERTVGTFVQCALCSSWSWTRYGATPLCLPCARRCAQIEGPLAAWLEERAKRPGRQSASAPLSAP